MYVGPNRALRGRAAILRWHRNGLMKERELLAQFDDLDLGLELTHAWTGFRREEFVLLASALVPSSPRVLWRAWVAETLGRRLGARA